MKPECSCHGKPMKFRSPNRWICAVDFNRSNRERRKRHSIQIKLERGGKCERCGYNKCLAALTWHHRNPSQKVIQLGNTRLKTGKGLESLRAESAKCDLICANCHAEEHDPYGQEQLQSLGEASSSGFPVEVSCP